MPNTSEQDYDQKYRNFQWDRRKDFNFCRDVFDQWAQNPDKIALHWIDDDGKELKFTFYELQQTSKQVCNLLRDQGIQRGDVVIVNLPRLVEWWVINLACLRMGAVIAPGTTQLTSHDLSFRIDSAQACCLITDPSGAEKVDQIPSPCPSLKSKIIVAGSRPGWFSYQDHLDSFSPDFSTADTQSDEPAIMYFTSGTTGRPKMTVHTHASYPLGHKNTGTFWLDLNENDVHWNLSDTGWAKAAWSSLFGPWNLGATVFVHHSLRFNPKDTLKILEKYPITTLCAAPTHYRMFIQETLDHFEFKHLRHCVGAGEPMNPEVINTWKKATGLTIQDGYGQTETVLLVGNFPGMEPKIGSMGKAAPGFTVEIVDDEGQILPLNTEGHIAIKVKPERPLGLFKEYWKDPKLNQKVFVGDWYFTGDKGTKDEDGYFWFVGRADDVILSGGYRIGPFEVESALLEHPAVVECAAVSSPDQTRGEVVKAFVVLSKDATASDALVTELQEHVKTITAPYKYPRKIEFTSSLPKTVSQKIRRVELREREWAQAASIKN